MTDTEKAALERRIDELCAELHKSQANRDMWLVRANVTLKNLTAARTENKRLTETLQGTEREADRLTHEAAELSIENAKLRELVRMMWKPFCWAQSGYDVCLTDKQDKAIRDMVRELGVDVG